MTPSQIKEWEQRTATARQEFLAALPDLASMARLLEEIRQLRAAAEEAVKKPLLEKRAQISYKNGKPKKGQGVTLDMVNRELAAVERLFLLPGLWEVHRAWGEQERRLAADPWCHVRPGMGEDPHAGYSLALALHRAWQAAPVCFVPEALTFWERIAGFARTAEEEEARRQALWGQAHRRAAELRREMAAELGLFQESGPTSSAK